ncbi:MAG: hypothetical protein Q9163_005459 [Psora crenata]
MNDPSNGVHPQLLRHIHLVCNHKYAVMPSPNIDAVVKHLHDAPKITRDISTMTWMALIEPPRDGTLMLVWQPPQLQMHFASDGYVWVDPERPFSQQMRGFTVEMYIHNSGFRPGIEGMTTHARRRYRLVPGREPVANLPPIDPSLWLIHYYATEPVNHIPTANLQVGEQAGRLMAERNSLQGHGLLQLQHKEFMLRDRDNWPTINLPGSNAPTYSQQAIGYPNNIMAHINRSQHPTYMQHTQAAMPQGSIGPSPAKRPRHSFASHGHASATAIPMPVLPHEATFDDDEATSGTDYMDVLTPQQISRSRYVQHHEWLEEVLNSPYDSYQIVPGTLGLGRKGELESLTRDFFDSPENGTPKAVLRPPGSPKEEDFEAGRPMVPDDPITQRVGRMEAGKAEDFTKRAAQRMADLHAEMEALKRQHARQMAKIKKGQAWSEAEQSLRVATMELMNGDNSRPPREREEQTDQIIKSMERRARKRITPIKEVKCIEKGGLEDKPQPNTNGDADMDMDGSAFIDNGLQLQAPVHPSNFTPTHVTPQAVEPVVPQPLRQQSLQEQQPPLPSTLPPPRPDVSAGRSETLPGSKDTSADDWVLVNKDDSTNDQYHSQQQEQERSAFESFTNDAAMPMENSPDNLTVNPQDAGPIDGGLTFEDHDFGGGIDFGDLDTAGDELSGYAQEIQDLGGEQQQTLTLGDTSTGDTFQAANVPPVQGDQFHNKPMS